MSNNWKQQLIIKILTHGSEGIVEYHLGPIKPTYLRRRHRLNSPAMIYYNGSKRWFKNDKLHNPNGPAVIHHDGFKEWWINSILIKHSELWITPGKNN